MGWISVEGKFVDFAFAHGFSSKSWLEESSSNSISKNMVVDDCVCGPFSSIRRNLFLLDFLHDGRKSSSRFLLFPLHSTRSSLSTTFGIRNGWRLDWAAGLPFFSLRLFLHSYFTFPQQRLGVLVIASWKWVAALLLYGRGCDSSLLSLETGVSRPKLSKVPLMGWMA